MGQHCENGYLRLQVDNAISLLFKLFHVQCCLCHLIIFIFVCNIISFNFNSVFHFNSSLLTSLRYKISNVPHVRRPSGLLAPSEPITLYFYFLALHPHSQELCFSFGFLIEKPHFISSPVLFSHLLLSSLFLHIL